VRRLAIGVVGSVLLVAAVAGGSEAGPPAEPVRLNQMQVIGSHNSYHIEPPPEVLEQYISVSPNAIELAYTHAPLGEQFSFQGVRQIELDVFWDPAGTRFRPKGVTGFKVLHIAVIDEGSTCLTFVACLGEVKAWSDQRQAHMPLAVLVELKDADVPPALLSALDAEIRSVFAPDRLLTPDDVRGERATLEQAVLEDGWPAIDDIRGRVLFLLDNRRDEYAAASPNLAGRAAFTPSTPGQPDAAFLKRNDPTGASEQAIRELVEAGYIIRTRADGPVLTPLSGDVSQRDAALASGAQWVSTDYPVPGMATRWNGSDYVARIPGGAPARCNPVNAPVGCRNVDIEDLPPEMPPTTTIPRPEPAAAPVRVAAPRFTG
jgi:hypothetical protein